MPVPALPLEGTSKLRKRIQLTENQTQGPDGSLCEEAPETRARCHFMGKVPLEVWGCSSRLSYPFHLRMHQALQHDTCLLLPVEKEL